MNTDSQRRKIFFVLLLLLLNKVLIAQYTFRGRVFKGLTGKPMTFGNVLSPTSEVREPRIGKKTGELDSLGYFTIILKDSANVKISIDCSVEGKSTKIVSYSDTLIIFTIKPDCYDFNTQKAKKDIIEKNIFLLYNGGINNLPNESDKVFEKKYNVQYHNFADTPELMDCIRLYNTEVAQYLNKKFGKEWTKEVRKEIQFLSD